MKFVKCIRPRLFRPLLFVFLFIGAIWFASSYRIAIVPVSTHAMTLSKMQAVVTAITNAGFAANATLRPDGTWQIRSDAPDYVVDASQVCGFATAQGISAKLASVLYF